MSDRKDKEKDKNRKPGYSPSRIGSPGSKLGSPGSKLGSPASKLAVDDPKRKRVSAYVPNHKKVSNYGGIPDAMPPSTIATAPPPPPEPKMTKGELPPPEVQRIFDSPPNITIPIAFLGSGSYAKVWKVKYKDKIRAVKVIDTRQASRQYKEKFMQREIDIVKGLIDDHIIRVKEIKKSRHICLVYMEYADGGTLVNLLKDGPLTEIKCRPIFFRICKGLQYLHHNKIAHRDMKLENILLDKAGNPKLTDFSYAITCDKTNFMTKTFCGTLPYIPPELMQDEEYRNYDPMAADIWSLGICLYVATNNALPFRANERKMDETLDAQLNRRWTFKERVASKLSPDFKDLVGKLLEPRPRERPTIDQILQHKWFKNTD